MLENLKEKARQTNSRSIVLEVRISNMAALNLYQKWGFKKVGARPNYYTSKKGKEDAMIMEHILT